MSSSSSSSSSSFSSTTTHHQEGEKEQRNVIYEKVIRPPPFLPDVLFLGYLVEYLQERFTIPERLPMVYDTWLPPEEEDTDDDDAYVDEEQQVVDIINGKRKNIDATTTTKTTATKSRFVVGWDSPLSPASDATSLRVEVVGIYSNTDKQKAKQNNRKNGVDSADVPSLAMVAVSKRRQQQNKGGSIPPMLANLFADSERQIIRALDRGLEEDFMAGRSIPFDEDNNAKGGGKYKHRQRKQTFEESQQEMLEDFMETSRQELVEVNDGNDDASRMTAPRANAKRDVVVDVDSVNLDNDDDNDDDEGNRETTTTAKKKRKKITKAQTKKEREQRQQAAWESMMQRQAVTTAPPSSSSKRQKNTDRKKEKEEFAVRQAAAAAAAKTTGSSGANNKNGKVVGKSKKKKVAQKPASADRQQRPNTEYAVQAAAKARAKNSGKQTNNKKKESKVGSSALVQEGEFAVAEAAKRAKSSTTTRRAAATKKKFQRQQQQQHVQPPPLSPPTPSLNDGDVISSSSSLDLTNIRPPALDQKYGNNNGRAFQATTVSTPEQYTKRAEQRRRKQQQQIDNNQIKKKNNIVNDNDGKVTNVSTKQPQQQESTTSTTTTTTSSSSSPTTNSKQQEQVPVVKGEEEEEDEGVQVGKTDASSSLPESSAPASVKGATTSEDQDNNKQQEQHQQHRQEQQQQQKERLRKYQINVIPDQPVHPTSAKHSTTTATSGSNDETNKTSCEAEQQEQKQKLSDSEAMQNAVDTLTEIADRSRDVTPEELLERVLEFGDEEKQKEAVGAGFVSGALEKAKDILRSQHAKHQARKQQQRPEQKRQPSQVVREKENSDTGGRVETKTSNQREEEELRQMFQAGERIAEGRIAVATEGQHEQQETDTQQRQDAQDKRQDAQDKRQDAPSSSSSPFGSSSSSTLLRNGKDERYTMTPQEEQIVDDLIASERTISRHARSLDDELTELEVQINPPISNAGQEMPLDRNKRPLFDIFSGPEVYDPNVDPETAVNWPGALPGTHDNLKDDNYKVPKELRQAVQQAKFAAEILSKVQEEQQEQQHNNNDKVSMEDQKNATTFTVGGRTLTLAQVQQLRKVVREAVEIGLIPDPLVLMQERARLEMILRELWEQPEERFGDIVDNYRDLLLSENFVQLVRDRLQDMAERDLREQQQQQEEVAAATAGPDEQANDSSSRKQQKQQDHARERELLGQLVGHAQLLLKQTRALGAELEAQQLEVIRSICKVAMDDRYVTEQEAAEALTDAVRDMRPLLDDAFVAYLKYATAEEEGRLARAGHLDDPEHNRWLCVLKIVQQGVYTELATSINRYLEHIWYVLRMETPQERRMLLSKLIDVMPTLDVRPFVQVVQNIVGSLGDAVEGNFDGVVELGEMTNKLLQLHRDCKELLPPERIALKSRHADEWAARQKKRLLEQRKVANQRLKAARETEHLDGQLEAGWRGRGEVERFD